MSELAWRNRRVLADRLGWPDGVLEDCERLDREWPRWSIGWWAESRIRGFERPAGFHASITGTSVTWWGPLGVRREPWVDAATADELAVRMGEVQEQVEAEEERRAQPLRSVTEM